MIVFLQENTWLMVIYWQRIHQLPSTYKQSINDNLWKNYWLMVIYRRTIVQLFTGGQGSKRKRKYTAEQSHNRQSHGVSEVLCLLLTLAVQVALLSIKEQCEEQFKIGILKFWFLVLVQPGRHTGTDFGVQLNFSKYTCINFNLQTLSWPLRHSIHNWSYLSKSKKILLKTVHGKYKHTTHTHTHTSHILSLLTSLKNFFFFFCFDRDYIHPPAPTPCQKKKFAYRVGDYHNMIWLPLDFFFS